MPIVKGLGFPRLRVSDFHPNPTSQLGFFRSKEGSDKKVVSWIYYSKLQHKCKVPSYFTY
jgi:hypothetical protein